MSVIVNGKEYPDERSVPEKYRMYSQEATRLRDPGNFSADLPPNVGRSILPHVTTFSGMMSTLARTYRQHDEAIRHNKHNANMMRRDPMIMGPLFARQMAVALLQWQIQPEDSNDEKQVQIAKELSFMVCRIPRLREYLRNLMEAVWYGRYGIKNVWGFARDSRGVRYRTVVDWVPVNGDKLLFRYDDGTGRYDHNQIGIKVSVAHIKNDIWAGKPDIEWNSEGTGVFLRRWERSRLVIHKNFMMDGDYEDPTTAGMIHGVGLRHFLYWSWYQKQETLAQLAEVVERAGMGFTVYNYPAGNAQAKEEVERLAEEQAHKNQIVLPMEVSNPDAYGIQQIPPNTQGIMALQSLIDDYFGSWIIKFILGQTLSYRAEAGTPGISDLHRDSFLQIVKYDSLGVEETVTKELIRMLLLFNFPSYQNVNFQFKLNTEEAVPLEKLQALQAAWSMGAKIKSKDVMGLIGLNVAGDTDQALYNPQVLASLKEYEMMEEQQEQEEQGDQVSQMSESQDEALAAMLGPIMQAKKYDKKESDMPSIKEDLHELLLKPHESQNSHQRVVDHLSAMGMEADAKNLESSKFKDDYVGYIKDLIERLFGSEEERKSEDYAKKEKSGNYKPNQGMKGNAKRGLELRKKHGKGGTSVGVARARDIMNGKDLSFSTVKRMHSFFSRHAGNEEGGEDDAGYIAWLLWGGDSGRNWARSIVESERKNQVPLSALTDDVENAVDPGVEANPNPGVVEPPKTETAQAEVVEEDDPSIIDTPREGRDDKSVTGSILSGVLEGASGGLKRRVMGQPQAQYDKDKVSGASRSEDMLSNKEACGEIAAAIQSVVSSALKDKMQPERNAMGAGPRDHSPEDFDVTNKQINGQATANRGTMPKQATQSSMPSKEDKGSVSTNPVSKTGMSSDATRMDRGASLDDMRDKFMKYRKTKLIEMLQPFVQEDPDFSLTDAQGKKRRTSLFKADKYSLAYSLAERYAEAQDPFARTAAVNKNINNIISDYTGGQLTPGMKDHAEVADKLHEAWSETHGEHLGHVSDFNSNFDRFRTALGFKSTSGFNNALKKAEDVDQIKGFDELEKGASEDLLNSAKNLGIELGEGDPNQQLLQALKSGKQKRLGKLSSDNWIKAVEKLKAAGMDLANYSPEEVEGVASKISDQAGSGKQLEFDPDPDEVNFELDRARQRDEDRGREASKPGSQQFLGLESEPSVTQIESGEGDPNQQLLQATQTADEGGKPSVDSVPDDYSDIPFEGFQSELGDTDLSPSQVNELLSQGNPDQPLTEEEEKLADKQRERLEALRERGKLAASQVSQSISDREKAQADKTQELRERGQSAIAGVEQSMEGRAVAEERERQLIEGTPEEIASQKDIAAQQALLGVSSQEDMANQIEQVIQNDMEQIGKRIDAEAERWKTNIKIENERIGKVVEEENRIKQFFSQSEDPIRQYHQMAIPHVDSDIKIKVNINSRKDPSQEPIRGDISFASDGKGDYFMKLVNAEGEEYLYTSKRAEKVLGDQFNRLVGEVIKKDNKRWSERLDIAGLVAPQKTTARGLAKGDQIYLTREEKTVIDSHVVNAMRGLGPGAGGIDFADYSNFDDAAEASYEQMRGHIEDIQKPGGWFEHMESIGFKMNSNASVAENYLNGIQHAM
ncbi:MAG: hypothetical protein VXX23_05670, partial [Actinomycetota bacterium]|nr:hypothetical protein [Actinomycetota bacterium]